MNVIQCYDPTNYSKEVKDQFYNWLQSVIDTFSERDVTILMGHFNAKRGSHNIEYEEIMGQHGISNNGWGLADLCALNKLVSGGSVFPYWQIHKTMHFTRSVNRNRDWALLYEYLEDQSSMWEWKEVQCNIVWRREWWMQMQYRLFVINIKELLTLYTPYNQI